MQARVQGVLAPGARSEVTKDEGGKEEESDEVLAQFDSDWYSCYLTWCVQ